MKIHNVLAEKVAANVKARREALRLTQRDLASLLHTSQAYVSLIEKAERNPSLSMIGNLAEALRTSVEEIIR